MASRIYGVNVSVPNHWPVEETGNRSRQRLVAAQVPSRAAFRRLLEAHGIGGVTDHFLSVYGYPDMSGAVERFVAEHRPGTLLYAPRDNGHEYLLAPGPEEGR